LNKSAFHSGLPVVATAFVNRAGAIGLNLLPILLVERQVASVDASLVLGIAKGVILVSSLLGGIIADRWGVRWAFLLAMGMQVLGLATVPFMEQLALLALMAAIAQLGNTMFGATSRLMIKQFVAPAQQQEALAWLRTGNNMGQIISFSLGALLASFGTALLFLFDAFTSLLAFIFGMKWLPGGVRAAATHGDNAGRAQHSWRVFIIYGIFVAGYSFLYDLFMIGAAGRLELVFPDEGLRLFSLVMVVNTVVCTLLSVPLSRRASNARRVLPIGFVLSSLGGALMFLDIESRPLLFGGVLLLSIGELLYTSLAQFLLLQINPARSGEGTSYGAVTTLQAVGRILASSTAFPLLVHGQYAMEVFLLLPLPFLLLFASIQKQLPR
jgi:predicted MFS family arabinose efflux permease